MISAVAAGFCVLGLQFGLNAASGMIIRRRCARTAPAGRSVGRSGSILGPILGGYFVAQHVPLPKIFLLWTIRTLDCFLAVLKLTIFYRSRFKDLGLRESTVENQA